MKLNYIFLNNTAERLAFLATRYMDRKLVINFHQVNIPRGRFDLPIKHPHQNGCTGCAPNAIFAFSQLFCFGCRIAQSVGILDAKLISKPIGFYPVDKSLNSP